MRRIGGRIRSARRDSGRRSREPSAGAEVILRETCRARSSAPAGAARDRRLGCPEPFPRSSGEKSSTYRAAHSSGHRSGRVVAALRLPMDLWLRLRALVTHNARDGAPGRTMCAFSQSGPDGVEAVSPTEGPGWDGTGRAEETPTGNT